MAKGVNPIEQHVEKAVVGIAGLLFVFVVYSYVISTPVTVSVAGKTLSPGELDRELGAIAAQVATGYQQARFTPPQTGNGGDNITGPVEEIHKAQQALEAAPKQIVSPVAWAPEFEAPEGTIDGVIGSRHALATVKAPVIDGVYTGVTQAGLVDEPLVVSTTPAMGMDRSGRGVPATTAAAEGKDVVWAFVSANFDMQAQYDVFTQAGYTREQANAMLFMDVQAQRQVVYPDGSTGPWEDVQPYRTARVNYPSQITIRQDGTVGYGDDDAMRALFANLQQAQEQILYPLPEILGGDPFTPYGIPTPVEETQMVPGQVMRPAPMMRRPSRGASVSRSRGRSGGSMDRGAGGMDRGAGGMDRGGVAPRAGGFSSGGGGAEQRLQAVRALQEARKARDEKRYEDALQLLSQAQGVMGLETQVAQLEQEILQLYEQQQEEQTKRQAEEASFQARNAELWVYDMQAPAGRTCRYRTRVVLFNVFAHPDIDRNELKDPQAGAQVAMVGEWSEPSEPITIADSRYFFFVGSQADKRVASVDVFRFQQGRWFKDTLRNLSIGDAIGEVRPTSTPSGRVDVDYRTGIVVVDIGTDPSVAYGTDTKGSSLRMRQSSSPMLVSMDTDGTIRQRWSVVDRRCPMYKELQVKVEEAAAQPVAASSIDLPRR